MIRRITPADRETYLQMTHDFYHSEAVLHAVPDAYFVRAFDEMMRSDEYLLGLIFEIEGKTAGYALLVNTWSQEAGGRAVWIDEIYVLPEFRGQGMAKQFFAELKEIAPAARYRLEIEPDNERAEALYKSVGFEELGYKQLVIDIPQ
jgi:GNAT superfamily N-acetyltransferase